RAADRAAVRGATPRPDRPRPRHPDPRRKDPVNRTPAPVATAPVTDPRPARATRLALALAVLLAAVGTVLMVLRRDALPDPLAVHWGPEGADGFLSWSGATTRGAARVVGTPLLLVRGPLLPGRRGRPLPPGTAGGP